MTGASDSQAGRVRVATVITRLEGGAGALRWARRRARLALGVPADATVVGAVGRLTYQKAPEDFLAALAGLGRPGVIGVWVGGGELAGRMASMARSMPWVRLVLAGGPCQSRHPVHRGCAP
jgi:glycosyltransferase involved in cell wall biosynthesis